MMSKVNCHELHFERDVVPTPNRLDNSTPKSSLYTKADVSVVERLLDISHTSTSPTREIRLASTPRLVQGVVKLEVGNHRSR